MNLVPTIVTVVIAVMAVAGVSIVPPQPGDGFDLVLVRGALVLPAWLLLPGLPWVALWTTRRQAASRSFTPRAVVFVIEAAMWSLAVAVVWLALLKLLQWTPSPVIYLLGIAALAAPPLPLLARQAALRLVWPARREWVAMAVAACALVCFGALSLGSGARRLENFWYHHRALSDRIVDGPTLHPSGAWGAVEIQGPEGAEARVYRPDADALQLVADGDGTATVLLLLQGPIGSEIRVRQGNAVVAHGSVDSASVEDPQEGPTLRYLDRGIACAVADVQVTRGEGLEVEIDREGAGTIRLIDLTSSGYEAVWALERAGPRHIHYYQILNIAEIVAWGREMLRDRYVVLTQPPAWPYIVGPMGLLLGPDLPSAYLLMCLVLLVQVVVAVQLIGALVPRAPLAALLLPTFAALIQGRMLVDGSMVDFPDPLYSLAIVAACLALVDDDLSLFAGAGGLASLLRYPGALVITFAAWLYGWLTGLHLRADRHLLALWIPMAGLVAALVVAGAVGGHLEAWWTTVWFENTTEHYHGDYSLPSLLPRIPRFYAEWFSICGPLLLLGLPLEGRRARLPMVLALAYSLLMCTADHVSPHYFVPLIALAAVSTAVNLARWTVWAPPLVREVIVAIVVAGMALWII